MRKHILFAALAVSVCAGAMTGCGSKDAAGTDSAQTTGADEAGDAADKAEDGEPVSITVGVGQQFTTLDPGLSTETVNRFAIAHMYAGLYKKLEDGSVVPDLAADEPEVSEDGLTYTIKLRDGITWSDGEPVKAQDFVYAVNRLSLIHI